MESRTRIQTVSRTGGSVSWRTWPPRSISSSMGPRGNPPMGLSLLNSACVPGRPSTSSSRSPFWSSPREGGPTRLLMRATLPGVS